MKNPCYSALDIDNNRDGACCCNCEHQQLIVKHPWNKSEFARGRTNEKIGYGCTTPELHPHITFMERKHSMCECHKERTWLSDSEQQTWNILSFALPAEEEQ